MVALMGDGESLGCSGGQVPSCAALEGEGDPEGPSSRERGSLRTGLGGRVLDAIQEADGKRKGRVFSLMDLSSSL